MHKNKDVNEEENCTSLRGCPSNSSEYSQTVIYYKAKRQSICPGRQDLFNLSSDAINDMPAATAPN
jgi:hypothetical protein